MSRVVVSNSPICLKCQLLSLPEQTRVHPLLPYGIMGTNALVASLLCMTLPETSGTPTAETMDSEEGVELGIQNIAMDDTELEKEKEKDEEKKEDLNGGVMKSRANHMDDSSINTAF